MMRYSLLVVMLIFMGTALAETSVPTQRSIQDIRERVTQSEELAGNATDILLDELEMAERLLDQFDARRFDLLSAQQEAASFSEQAVELEDEVQSLTSTARFTGIDFDDEQRLEGASDQLEVAVGQLHQSLFNAREHDAWLRARASAIGDEMVLAAANIKTFNTSARARILTTITDEGATMQPLAFQVHTLVNRTKAHAAIETINLLRSEQTTLAPRQTLASLHSRVLQLRLERTRHKLDQYWSRLNQIRIDNARLRLAKLSEESLSPSLGFDISQVSTVDARIQWTRSEVLLLEQEPGLLLRTARAADSIVKIYEIRRVLAQINSTGTVSDSLTDMVRTLRDRLPDTALLGSELSAVREDQRQLQVERILLESALHGLGNSAVSSVNDATLFHTVNTGTLVELVNLLRVTNRVADRLVMLEASLSEAQILSEEVGLTLDGSVLWLRSNESASLMWFKNVYDGLQWMVKPETFRAVGPTLSRGFHAKPQITLLLLLALVVIIVAQRRVKNMLKHAAMGVGNVGEDRYWATPAALCASVLSALPVPLLPMVIYWVLQSTFLLPGSATFALAGSLLATAMVLGVLLFFQALCRSNGVFLSHFGWNEHGVNRLHRHLSWFIWICALCTFMLTLTMLSDRPELHYGLGVIAFMMVSLAMSALLHVCLRPNSGVAFELTDALAQSFFARVAIWALIGVPTIVGVLPLLGYFDTAVEIQSRAFHTGVYLMAIVVLIGLAMREFMVAHRRMSLRKARAKRAAREAERAAQVNAPVSGDATPDLSFAWDDDHKRVANQAQQLLRIAGVVLFVLIAWMVWKPLFPVLDIVNEIVLWRTAQSSGGSTGGQSMTLGQLLFALGVVVLGIVGSRNLRGVLEIVVFERLKLDTGARYAINAIASYSLLGAALLLGIAQLGVDWSKLQWIVAALGVGLGFGLQEIVANFISGLIILFERPVRVGDTVTIGGISGTVSNIQIRATTLTDFDNREVLLPNKSIITENVTNWTLHDSVTRILLNIGVAYGSNIEQVRSLLMQCIEDSDDILTTPEPTVFFINHGDSSLDFEVRVFVATPAHRLPVTHALNAAINTILAAHGIEIPFPQRVVHVRTEIA